MALTIQNNNPIRYVNPDHFIMSGLLGLLFSLYSTTFHLNHSTLSPQSLLIVTALAVDHEIKASDI
jgi:hypothetical protein